MKQRTIFAVGKRQADGYRNRRNPGGVVLKFCVERTRFQTETQSLFCTCVSCCRGCPALCRYAGTALLDIKSYDHRVAFQLLELRCDCIAVESLDTDIPVCFLYEHSSVEIFIGQAL